MEQFLIYLIKSSGITALFLLFYVLLLKRETFFRANRIYLLAGLGLSLLLPLLVFTKTIWIQPMPSYQTDITNIAIEPSTAVGSINWLSLLFYGYCVGVFLFAMRFALQLLSLHRLISKSIKLGDGKFISVETDQQSSPFSFLRYIVYNPNLHAPSELKTILAHERIHAQGKHSLDIIVIQLFTIFQWCNPFIWWYRACLGDNLEYLADTETIAQNTPKTEYQYLLLKTGIGEKHSSLVTPFFNTSIKKRINMLNKNRSNRKNAIKYTLMLPLLITFILIFNVKTEAQVNARYQLASPVYGTDANSKPLSPLSLPFGTLQDSIQIVYQIKKGTTDKELSDLADKIAGQGGELKIKELKRNRTGLISNIALTYKIDENRIVSGVYSDPKGIAMILFGRSKINGQFIVGENEKREKKIILYGSPKPVPNSNQGMGYRDTTITKFGRKYSDRKIEENVFRRLYEDDEKKRYLVGKETTKEDLEGINAYVDSEELSGAGVRKVEEYNKSTMTIHDSITGYPLTWGIASGVKLDIRDQDNPLILLDGKEISKIEMDKIDPESIKSIDIWKGQQAIDRFGEKRKDGVVVVKLKTTLKVG